jgi:hypothetical protein
MTRDMKRAGLLLAAGGLALLAMVSLGRSEVSRTPAPAPRPTPAEITLVPAGELALRAQCWQEGVRIIDQNGLQGLALTELVKQQAVTFSGADGEQPRTLILPFADGMCLIQQER